MMPSYDILLANTQFGNRQEIISNHFENANSYRNVRVSNFDNQGYDTEIHQKRLEEEKAKLKSQYEDYIMILKNEIAQLKKENSELMGLKQANLS